MSGWLTEAWSRTPPPRAWSIGATIRSERSSGCCCLPHQTGCCHRSCPSRGAIANAHHASTSRADRVPSALASISRWPEAVSSSVPEPRRIWRHSTDGIRRPRRILGQAARCVLRGWAEGGRPGRTVALVPPSRIRLTTNRGPPERRSSHADVSTGSFRTPLAPWAQAYQLDWRPSPEV